MMSPLLGGKLSCCVKRHVSDASLLMLASNVVDSLGPKVCFSIPTVVARTKLSCRCFVSGRHCVIASCTLPCFICRSPLLAKAKCGERKTFRTWGKLYAMAPDSKQQEGFECVQGIIPQQRLRAAM